MNNCQNCSSSEKKFWSVLQVMKTSNRQIKTHSSDVIGSCNLSHNICEGAFKRNSSFTLKGKMDREQYFLVTFLATLCPKGKRSNNKEDYTAYSMNELKNAAQTMIPQYLCHMCPWQDYSTGQIQLWFCRYINVLLLRYQGKQSKPTPADCMVIPDSSCL